MTEIKKDESEWTDEDHKKIVELFKPIDKLITDFSKKLWEIFFPNKKPEEIKENII